MARVLVCDDAPDLRLLMALTLEGAGHEVVQAEGGAAVSPLLAERDDIDAIVLDVQMPLVDGWDVLQAVRADPVHHTVPVVMCTVKFSHEDLIRAWELGCDGYVNKPFDLDTLVRAVEEVIALAPADRTARRSDALQRLTSHP